MKKVAIIVTVAAFVLIVGLLIYFNMDDLDNFVTGISASPLCITPITGEIGAVFNESDNASILGPGIRSESTEVKLIGATWISPSKAQVDSAYRYSIINCYIDVRNATNTIATYSVSSRNPDYIEAPYTAMPLSWILIDNPNIVVLPGQSTRIPVIINVPKSLPSKKLQFWISVKNTGISGMIKTELCAKWFVNIR